MTVMSLKAEMFVKVLTVREYQWENDKFVGVTAVDSDRQATPSTLVGVFSLPRDFDVREGDTMKVTVERL